MTTVLQISDTHILPKGELVSGRLDTTISLERLVRRILEIRHQVGPIGAVIVTGDLSEDGSAESYQHFKEILALLELPLYVIPGNHDARDALRSAFEADGYLPADGKLNWHQRVGRINLVGLDTLIEGEGTGELDAATLAFLRECLHSVGQEPVLLALHHPPFKTDIRFMDKIGLLNVQDLTNVLSEFDGELRIICGHIHSLMVVGMGRHVVLSSPSPCSSFALDTRRNAPVGFMDLGDGCLLHKWNGQFMSTRIGPFAGTGPFPF